MKHNFIGRMISAPTGKIKPLWERFKYWLIKKLGGYAFPPCPPEIKAEKVETVKVSASLMVNKDRYNKDCSYRGYIRSELSRILAGHILDQGVISDEKVIDFNDAESVVKVSATLVKEGK